MSKKNLKLWVFDAKGYGIETERGPESEVISLVLLSTDIAGTGPNVTVKLVITRELAAKMMHEIQSTLDLVE